METLLNIPRRSNERPLGQAGHGALQSRWQSKGITPLSPSKLKELEAVSRALLKEGRIHWAYEGVWKDRGYVTPEPGECLYSLVDANWRRILYMPIGNEGDIDNKVLAIHLAEISETKKYVCKKCGSVLPVIMAYSMDSRDHTLKTWGIYCPTCLISRKVRASVKNDQIRL
jgi:DNA-directed RNA polymerase subunit RPC12/RpoP